MMEQDQNPPEDPGKAVLIAGPTASGKSSLAIAIAEARNGVILNADSMQVYRDLRVLTARPTQEDEARVPHAMYGHIDSAAPYSTGHWLEEMKQALARIRSEGRLPVIVGGTGLYFRALLHGLSPMPAIAPEIRDHYRNQGDVPLDTLRAELLASDPAWAADTVARLDRQRVLRALEVIKSTGKSLKHWQSGEGTPLLKQPSAAFVVAPPRDVLYDRINRRFDTMMHSGARAEVEHLLARNLPQSQPIMGALGVRQIGEILRGERSETDALDEVKMLTRRYAKRQMTWLRRNMQSWKWIETQENYQKSHEIFANIDQNHLTKLA